MSVDELAEAIQQGNTELYAELWQGVKNFVYKEANRYSAHSAFTSLRDDFCQAGYIAMVEAVEDYKQETGSFINWLAFYLKTAFAEAANIRGAKRQNDPLNNAISIYAPAYNGDDEMTIADTQADENAVLSFEEAEHRVFVEQLHEALECALNELEQATADLIRQHYFAGKTAQELAEQRGETVQQINNKQTAAIRKIRKTKQMQELNEFVEYATPYAARVSVREFTRTHTSAVERAVLWREKVMAQQTEKYG